jgi:hypothetical protein
VGVGVGNGLLVIGVGDGDYLREGGLREDVLQLGEVGLVCVCWGCEV